MKAPKKIYNNNVIFISFSNYSHINIWVICWHNEPIPVNYFENCLSCVILILIDKINLSFWDDFKYTVVQMAFNTDPMENVKILKTIKDLDPLYLRNDCNDSLNEETTDKDNECYDMRVRAIMDRYFFKEPIHPSLNFYRLINSIA